MAEDKARSAGTAEDVISYVKSTEFLLNCLRKAKLDSDLVQDVADACELNELDALALGRGDISAEDAADKLFLMQDEAKALLQICHRQCLRAGVQWGDGTTYKYSPDDEWESNGPAAAVEAAPPSAASKPAELPSTPVNAQPINHVELKPQTSTSGRSSFEHKHTTEQQQQQQHHHTPIVQAQKEHIQKDLPKHSASKPPPARPTPAVEHAISTAVTPPPARNSSLRASSAETPSSTTTPKETPKTAATPRATPRYNKPVLGPGKPPLAATPMTPAAQISSFNRLTTPASGPAASTVASSTPSTDPKRTPRPSTAPNTRRFGLSMSQSPMADSPRGSAIKERKPRPKSGLPISEGLPSYARPTAAFKAAVQARIAKENGEELTPGASTESSPVKKSPPSVGQNKHFLVSRRGGSLELPPRENGDEKPKKNMFDKISSSLLRPTKAFLAWTTNNEKKATPKEEAPKFKARPIPKTVRDSYTPPAKRGEQEVARSTTTPEPFKLASAERHQKAQEELAKKVEEEKKKQEYIPAFKAAPMPSTSQKRSDASPYNEMGLLNGSASVGRIGNIP